MCLNRYFRDLFSTDEAFRRYLNRLHIEKGLYSNPGLGAGDSSKDLFVALWSRRGLWFAPEGRVEEEPQSNDDDAPLPVWRLPARPATTENFKISVSARFKPKEEVNGADEGGDKNAKVTLPLHQRIQLIKMSRRFKKVRMDKERGETLNADRRTSHTNMLLFY